MAFLAFLPSPMGQAQNDAALLAPSRHVVITTTKFGEFLPNSFGGDCETDRKTDSRLQYPHRSFQKSVRIKIWMQFSYAVGLTGCPGCTQIQL